jgi:hypothetical protein
MISSCFQSLLEYRRVVKKVALCPARIDLTTLSREQDWFDCLKKQSSMVMQHLPFTPGQSFTE